MPEINKSDTDKMRHSAAHVLAAAVLELIPGAKIGIGPVIENGFYYDFQLPQALTEKDLPLLENKMRQIIKANLPFQKKLLAVKEAKEFFQKNNQPFKVVLINKLQKEGVDKVTLYTCGKFTPLEKTTAIKQRSSQREYINGAKTSPTQTTSKLDSLTGFTDLCKGPHLSSTGKIKAFKLQKISGAYWLADEKNPMLTRVYGLVFDTEKELREHQNLLLESQKRDHKKLGPELDLFLLTPEVGSGLPLLTSKGTVIRDELIKLLKELLADDDYQFVTTPHLGSVNLYKTSGHFQKYRESNYPPLKVEGEEMMLKPMNCPHHIQIFKNKRYSYKDLPLRMAEFGTVYRLEKKGEVQGLTRVRGITIDDAHLFIEPEDLSVELKKLIILAKKLFAVFSLRDFRVTLSVRDWQAEGKYIGDEKLWRKAEEALLKAISQNKLKYDKVPGEAAFYGPKIDFVVKDVLGRNWQLTTIQADYTLPERFNLSYVGKDGREHRPVIIHRGILGSLERFIGILIEHYAGAFPLWISPIQAQIIPISDKFNKYATDIKTELKKHNFRVFLNDRNESLGKKIREAEKQKIPYLLIVGEKEVKSKTVSVRKRAKGDLGAKKLAIFLKEIEKERASRQ